MKTLHVLGLPNTITSKDSECPITQKIYKFCRIFENHPNYKVIHYGHNKSSTAAQTHVNVTSDEVLSSVLNIADDDFSQGYYDLASRVFRNNAIREIIARKAKGDFVLAFDVEAKEITDELNRDNDLIVMEPSVAGAEAFSFFRCYESYPLKAAFAGTEGVSKDEPRWYWRVVPACFDIFDYKNQPKENWAVYIVKDAHPWGLTQAIQACHYANIKLKICGEVDIKVLNMSEWPTHVEYLGKVDASTKNDLLSRACCGFLMSLKWEAFGASAVEMMLSGCVPITSDLGAMTEYVVDGVNGFRCNSLRDMVRAIKTSNNIDRNKVISFAQKNFSIAAARTKYERVFEDFGAVIDGRGWMEESDLVFSTPLGLDYAPLYR